MASIISASTTSGTALNMSADTTGVLQFATGATPTTAVTIDTSQNVGIGTTSPSTKLNIYGSSPSFYLEQNTGVAGNTQIRLNAAGASNTASLRLIDKYIWTSTANGSLLNIGNDLTTSQVSISSTGFLSVGDTATGGITARTIKITGDLTSGAVAFVAQSTVNTVGSIFSQFQNLSGTAIGSITIASASSVAYNTSSDYRLKENITPMTGALDKVALLKPVTYKWKLDGSDGEGFIAHELQAIVPNAVTGKKDAVDAEGKPQYQGVDTSFLVATLTAAIQEQQTIINDLKARVTALEGASL